MDISTALRSLGYTPLWLDLGIVSPEFVLAQIAELEQSKDKNQEHYRCEGFQVFLDSRESLTDEEIEGILRLTDDGPDRCDLRTDRIIGVIHSDLLTDQQLDQLGALPEVREAPIQRRYERARLYRRLRREGLSDGVFRMIVDSRDSELQRRIIERPDLSRKHVESLAKSGCNKKIRNVAAQLLRSRRFRQPGGGETL